MNPDRRDGRFNFAGAGCTQYLSLDAEAPYAEVMRAENLRTEREALTYFTTLWQLQVDEGSIVDYGTFDKAEAAGFPADALVDDDHERCQAEAERLRSFAVGGILTPSAALPGSTNLTLFGARVAGQWGLQVKLASMLPAQRLVSGHPPPGLTRTVRYYGQPHPALKEHQSGERRLF